MHSVVKVRTALINGRPTRFVGIPKEIDEKILAGYMAVHLDDMGRLIYTPVSEKT